MQKQNPTTQPAANQPHPNPSPLAGKTCTVKHHVPQLGGAKVLIADWFDRQEGRSWRTFSADTRRRDVKDYAVRVGATMTPIDDDVLCGHLVGGGAPVLVHATELDGCQLPALFTENNMPPADDFKKAA